MTKHALMTLCPPSETTIVRWTLQRRANGAVEQRTQCPDPAGCSDQSRLLDFSTSRGPDQYLTVQLARRAIHVYPEARYSVPTERAHLQTANRHMASQNLFEFIFKRAYRL